MTEQLKSFFDALPVNHWSSILIMIFATIFIIYPIYFYFSKEGKDERGRQIIATASFLSFIVTIVILSIVNISLYDVVSSSDIAYYWIFNFVVVIIAGVESASIYILRKIY